MNPAISEKHARCRQLMSACTVLAGCCQVTATTACSQAQSHLIQSEQPTSAAWAVASTSIMPTPSTSTACPFSRAALARLGRCGPSMKKVDVCCKSAPTTLGALLLVEGRFPSAAIFSSSSSHQWFESKSDKRVLIFAHFQPVRSVCTPTHQSISHLTPELLAASSGLGQAMN